MKILLTGANGYIGLRLLPDLLDAGHEVFALVRQKERFPWADFVENPKFHLLEGDVLLPESLPDLPQGIDAAYYLLHSMGSGAGFSEREAQAAAHFGQWTKRYSVKRLIYLGALVPQSHELSPHLESRFHVESTLSASGIPLTVLRASIIVGSGSASFEIIRSLVEKLPIMTCPKWTRTRCQPIAIRNVIEYLIGVLNLPDSLHQTYDIGGPERLTYQELLERYAAARGLKRWVLPVPFLSPRLSSYWLYFMTSTSYPLAKALVESLKCETICHDSRLQDHLQLRLLPYHEAITRAFARIAQNRVPSSWFDSLSSGTLNAQSLRSIRVPQHGILRDQQSFPLQQSREATLDAIWRLGGESGWPTMNWAWRIRGSLDRLFGGTGLRRGRRHPSELRPGDALDFWRVLLADRAQGRLILYAEMKMPGEAWLEFEVSENELRQSATFRPKGLLGRLYWYAVLPFHWILFPQMAKLLAGGFSHSGK